MSTQEVTVTPIFAKPKASNPLVLARFSTIIGLFLLILAIASFISVWKTASIIVSVFVTLIAFLLIVTTLMTFYIRRQWAREDDLNPLQLKDTPYPRLLRIFSNTALISALILMLIATSAMWVIWYNTVGVYVPFKVLLFVYFALSVALGAINFYIAYLHCLDINCSWHFSKFNK